MQTINYSTEKLLSNLNIDALNDMQLAAISAIEKNNNILLLSSTGSGKTLAFLIPILQKLDAQIK
ncbi:MAG: DEAD/DEAH box helicase, partial [Chitinophagaceae bacterium]